MSIADYVLDDGIVVVGEGRGWSIWHEPASNRVRFDVFAGDVHKTVPAIAPEGVAPHFAQAACLKLWRDAFQHDRLIAPVRNLRRFCDARWPA